MAKKWGFLLILALVLAVVTYPITTQIPAGLVPDDGYFYAKIASNIAAKHFSSFDGINPTDGYHQLWQYSLALVAIPIQAVTNSKSVLLVAFLTLDFFFLLGASLLAAKTNLERVFVFLSLACCEFLMEGHLLAFLVAGLIYGLKNEKKWPTIVCCGLIPLARIDATLIPLAIGVSLLASNKKQAAQLLGATLLGAAAHFALMLGLHGHLLSVSSQIKSGGASHGLKLFSNLGQRSPTLPIPFEPQGVTSVILASIAFYCLLKQEKGPARTVSTGLWLGVAIFTLGHLCFSEIHPWYYAPAFIGFPIVVIQTQKEQNNRVVLPGIALTAILFAGFLFKAVKSRSESGPVMDFVANMNKAVPPTEPIYAVDGSGYLGYWSAAPVVNGDGLVNSHEYAAKAKVGQLADYLQAHRIHYVLTNQPLAPTGPIVDFGGLKVTQDEADPVVTKQANGHYFFTNFVLWKLKN